MERLQIYSPLSLATERNSNDLSKLLATKDRSFFCLGFVALCCSDKLPIRYCHMLRRNVGECCYYSLFLYWIACLLEVKRRYRFGGFSGLSLRDFF